MPWLQEHWLDLLGWAGGALLLYSLVYVGLWFRTLNLIGSVMLTTFNILLGIWPMVALNGISSLINVWFLVRLVRERHDVRAFEVLEVDPDDTYLRHVLRVHGADILHFQPNFVWDHADDHARAFLVLHGDQTVGVVLLKPDEDDPSVARIQLDYVTPRFRDFSPGEFVWRRSRLLREQGFRQVITAPQMVDPYYARVGFHPLGDAYALDL